MNWEAIIITIIAGLLAAAPGILALLNGKRKEAADIKNSNALAEKIQAEYVDQITQTAMRLVDPLKLRISDLEAAEVNNTKTIRRLERVIKAYATRMQELLHGISILTKQILELKQEPSWKPDEWDVYDLCDDESGANDKA